MGLDQFFRSRLSGSNQDNRYQRGMPFQVFANNNSRPTGAQGRNQTTDTRIFNTLCVPENTVILTGYMVNKNTVERLYKDTFVQSSSVANIVLSLPFLLPAISPGQPRRELSSDPLPIHQQGNLRVCMHASRLWLHPDLAKSQAALPIVSHTPELPLPGCQASLT